MLTFTSKYYTLPPSELVSEHPYPQLNLNKAFPPQLRKLATSELKTALLMASFPKIIAVTFKDDPIEEAMRILESLPEDSKVALEAGVPQAVLGLKGSPYRENFFDLMAKRAVELGHTVIRLEKESVAFTREQLAQAREISDRLISGQPGKLLDLVPNNYWPTELGGVPSQHEMPSLWRTQMMLRELLRHEWKETDVAFISSEKATLLADFSTKPINGIIANREDIKLFRDELELCRLSSQENFSAIQRRRIMGQKIFSLTRGLKNMMRHFRFIS